MPWKCIKTAQADKRLSKNSKKKKHLAWINLHKVSDYK